VSLYIVNVAFNEDRLYFRELETREQTDSRIKILSQ